MPSANYLRYAEIGTSRSERYPPIGRSMVSQQGRCLGRDGMLRLKWRKTTQYFERLIKGVQKTFAYFMSQGRVVSENIEELCFHSH